MTTFKLFVSGPELAAELEKAMQPYVGREVNDTTRQDMVATISNLVMAAMPPIHAAPHVAVMVFPKFNVLYMTDLNQPARKLELIFLELLQLLPREEIIKELERVWPEFKGRVWGYEL